ncbi:MAG: hypothetical protein JSS42_06760 [Proteobacteria bacterium]|uniref:hypothetical protein n=1 Tax=Rudaea sp. TaxID=2136325 RepID=UPI00321FEB32|nr:hypothetical protein [Pseudomonadota bacterium]
MKTNLHIVIAGLLFASAASAADPQAPLDPVTVRSIPAKAPAMPAMLTLDCTPPNSAQQCGAFHGEVRRHFSNREIGMLFGAATAYPEYRSSYSFVKSRYENFAREYDARNLTAFAGR